MPPAASGALCAHGLLGPGLLNRRVTPHDKHPAAGTAFVHCQAVLRGGNLLPAACLVERDAVREHRPILADGSDGDAVERIAPCLTVGQRVRRRAPDGSLLGPFNPMLFSPAIAAAQLAVFHADKRSTSLSPDVHETSHSHYRRGVERGLRDVCA